MARHDESELTLINERNIAVLHEALKLERVKVTEALTKAENALRTVATVQEEMQQLRVQLLNIIQSRM